MGADIIDLEALRYSKQAENAQPDIVVSVGLWGFEEGLVFSQVDWRHARELDPIQALRVAIVALLERTGDDDIAALVDKRFREDLHDSPRHRADELEEVLESHDGDDVQQDHLDHRPPGS